MAIRYLRRGQTKLEAAPGEKKAEVQAEYIAGYFKMYENMESQYRESLKKGEELNLPLMQEAFSDGSADPVYQQLLAMKESGTPDFKALTSYLALTGGKKGDPGGNSGEPEGKVCPDAAGSYGYPSIL